MKLGNLSTQLLKDTPPSVQRKLNTLSSEQKLSIIKTAVSALLSDKQEEYFMMYMAGNTIPKIAELCGVNKSTVSRLIKKARRKIVWYIENIHIVRIEIE